MSNDNTKTYSVYRIWNTVTGRSYVGITVNRLNVRFNGHMSELRRESHHSRNMQLDFNSHGKKSFIIELLESGIHQEKAGERENMYIKKYNSIEDGYNTIKNIGSCVGIGGNHKTRTVKCVWNNIQYNTIKEAAIANNITPYAMARRLKKGYTCDSDINHRPRRVSCTWNNVHYPSIIAAAKALGIKPPTLKEHLDKGYTCDDDLQYRKKTNKK